MSPTPLETTHLDVVAPPVGSDPGEGFIYLGQINGPPVKVDVDQARDYLDELVFHMLRAVRAPEKDD